MYIVTTEAQLNNVTSSNENQSRLVGSPEFDKEERERLISTLQQVVFGLGDIGADYRIVGGFAIDLLADHYGIVSLSRIPNDIDIALERKGLEVFVKGPYQPLITGNYNEVWSLEDAIFESELLTTHSLTHVPIDLHVTPMETVIPVRTEPFLLDFYGNQIKLLSPNELYEVTKQNIRRSQEKGYSPQTKDLTRLEEIEKVLTILGQTVK